MKWRFAWALVLALVASPAFALGLGQIQVRSQYGEPLLAEIPIVSSDPAELRQLQARLAPPETFSRIGLRPPEGLVRDLQFNVALDASGQPVIRVTSAEPVDQPLLTFLIEADWGQGRLVREYSALLDAPDTIAAHAHPPIQAPEPDQGDRIVRPPEVVSEPVAAAEPEPGTMIPGPEAEAVADAPESGPAPEPGPAEEPFDAAAEPRAAAAAQPLPQAATGPVRVQAGETLSEIVQGRAGAAGLSTDQMMLALLRTNPEAFIGGNINLLREGAVLQMPAQDEAQRLSTTQASAEVRSQVARWREMAAPLAQPADTDTAVAEAGQTEAGDGEVAQASGPSADARLEIAPPSPSDGEQAGTRSGITAGGEGEMLRQELQETRESLAARDAEVEELKGRLAELEELQSQQQQLITLKDSELAAAQQRLAESNQEQAPALAQANEVQAGTPAPQDAGGGAAWMWIGLGLVLVIAAGLAWARLRRDDAVVAAPRPASRPTAAPADAGTAATRAGGGSPTWHVGGGAPASGGRAEPQSPPVAATPDPGPQVEPAVEPPADAVAPATQSEPATQPEPDPGIEPGPERLPGTPDPASSDLLTGLGERLELAKAYVELGDVDTARELLGEVAAADSAPESDEAARLLQELAQGPGLR